MLRSFALLAALIPSIATASTNRYIVGVDETATVSRLERQRATPFRNMQAFTVSLTESDASALRGAPGVRYVEPVIERRILETSSPIAAVDRNLEGQTIPAGVDLIRARDVWRVARGEAANVVVIDTGIDYRHPDLRDNYAGGFNAIAGTADPMDDHSHGTHVAGVIAATDNDIGVAGVAPRVRLWGVKAMRETGAGTTDHIVAGIDWVITQKRQRGGNWIINLSIGSQVASIAEREAVQRAIDEGILVIAGAGNDSTTTSPAPVSYPAAYPGVLAIGAVDTALRVAEFSNQGTELAAVAPGVGVLSSVPVGWGILAAVFAETHVFGGAALEGSATSTVTGRLVYCGIGRGDDFPASLDGAIAVIRRGGGISFSAKARRARNAGAKAVVFVNYAESTSNNFSLFDEPDPGGGAFDWPVAISLMNADGERVIASAGSTVTVVHRPDDYGEKNGTSMAAPHAAGAAALSWSVAPNAKARDVAMALMMSATDIGPPGFEPRHGHGAVNALAAATILNPAAFGIQPQPSGRRTLRRGR